VTMSTWLSQPLTPSILPTEKLCLLGTLPSRTSTSPISMRRRVPPSVSARSRRPSASPATRCSSATNAAGLRGYAEQLYALWQNAVARFHVAVRKALADGGVDQLVRHGTWHQLSSLRRLLIDLIKKYARPVGHANLIWESVDGLVGEDPPRRW
jgi:hypothetical protein